MSSPIIKSEQEGRQELGAPTSDPTFYLPKAELPRFLGALVRHGWIAILLMVLAAVATWFAMGRMPKIYQSSGSVYVSADTVNFFEVQEMTDEDSEDLESMHSVEQGMLSNTLLLRVIDKHQLVGDPTFAPEAKTRQGVLGELADRVGVELRRGSRYIDIWVEDTDPVRARDLVASIKSEYETWSAERQTALIEEVSIGLANEEGRLRKRMELSEEKLQAFREEHPVPGLEGIRATGSARDRLGILSERLTEAKTSRMELEAERDAFAKFDADNPDALAGLRRSDHGAEVLSLVRDLREKELEFDRVKERYLFKHPDYKRAARDVESVKEDLAVAMITAGEAVEKGYQVALAQEKALENEVAIASGDAVDVDGLRAQFAALSREAEADRELHGSVSRRLRETMLAGSVPASVLSWRDQPLVPEEASKPKRALFTPIAGMAGLCLGLMLVAGLELKGGTVRDTAAASRATGVPLLARIPAVGASEGMLLLSSPSSAAAEAFRRLRSVLIPASAESKAQTIMFTGARAGEGASFCAVNHAVSLAVQGHRTLLIDADLRSPGLSREQLKETPTGLSDLLAGNATAADTCVRTPVPGLYLISSGELKADASELLGSSRFPVLLEEAYRWFDRVVIDAPPVLGTSDAQAVARYADRTCMVIGEGGSKSTELRQTAEMLRGGGAKLVGFVWNEHPTSPGDAPSLVAPRTALPARGEHTLSISEATSD
ncbi:GumC family protein [Haloferula rosea]|uniref:non-specific protein-tyrosine kinase n=1 Tax=Haloferula rosea TaxID=490093 RepID=A0A934VFC2_9BACT|nr:polysaccharide biosynthesis tyrosine autokinase [Haloferula rosea]MBK1828214.1 polysaccharide biosynthesis tyrosine autokinase [Haloferula rosea]